MKISLKVGMKVGMKVEMNSDNVTLVTDDDENGNWWVLVRFQDFG